jgi:hypothetical protein
MSFISDLKMKAVARPRYCPKLCTQPSPEGFFFFALRASQPRNGEANIGATVAMIGLPLMP